MNLLIGFVIILCLACSELKTAEAATDLWTRLIAVGLVSIAVPGLALFQTLVVTQRFQNSDLPDAQRESTIKRLSVCHTAVWLTASLAIIWAVRWQDVVRGNWGFDRFPLLDEAFILAPVIFSLVASWAVFYEIQHSIDKTRTRWFELGDLKNRLGFVSIRFRVYFLLALIPISIAVLARDFSPWINNLSPTGEMVFYGAAATTITAGFPFLLLLILQNRRVENAELRTELIETCNQHRLFVRDVRVWQTGNRIVNALVAGMIPKFRIILLSDSLIKLFPKHELLAVVRHEAGHLRLWHLPTRVCFIILPLIALTADEQNPIGLVSGLGAWLSQMGLPAGSSIGFFAILYLVYLFFSLSWLSHKMEFEADIYSCQTQFAGQHGYSADPVLSKHMSDALLRLASISPSQLERRTVFHPSIRERIRLIQKIQSSPDKADLFQTSFARRRRIVLAVLVSMCLFALLV
jgi:Zn-dependent protease with chaperone function